MNLEDSPDFKTYCEATEIKTEWHQDKNKQIDQIDQSIRIQSPKINLHIFSVDFQQKNLRQFIGENKIFSMICPVWISIQEWKKET